MTHERLFVLFFGMSNIARLLYLFITDLARYYTAPKNVISHKNIIFQTFRVFRVNVEYS